jgi:hypothetical protein
VKAEYDFSEAEQGKFYHSDAELSFPVYLDADVSAYLGQLAEEREIDIQALVNEWLRAGIRVAQSVGVREGEEHYGSGDE